VVSGAGTSGRIAYLVARAFNKFFPDDFYFHYLIAGGDKALIVGQEGKEQVDRHYMKYANLYCF
jgi:N-acetylmuramic acid 6-phosphate (MurNAc-6-P) etherase